MCSHAEFTHTISGEKILSLSINGGVSKSEYHFFPSSCDLEKCKQVWGISQTLRELVGPQGYWAWAQKG